MTQQHTRTSGGAIRPIAAKCLVPGAWTTRWGDWVVHLRCIKDNWCVTVWRWTIGGRLEERTQLGLCAGFGSAVDATTWACDLLRESGAKVFIVDKPQLKLEDLLRFHPAPEPVT